MSQKAELERQFLIEKDEKESEDSIAEVCSTVPLSSCTIQELTVVDYSERIKKSVV
jgi:hypothetical protein